MVNTRGLVALPRDQSKMKTYLIWFVHEHVEFRHPELQSLIELLDAKLDFPERKLDGRRTWMVDARLVPLQF